MRVRLVVAVLLATAIELPSSMAESKRTSYVMTERPRAQVALSNVLYLNRCIGGCNIAPGPNDAQNNTVQSNIVSSPQTLSEFAFSNDVWNAVVECVREIYQPYNVMITDQDPGMVPHHEAMVAGTSLDIGYSNPQTLGVAPLACAPLDNVISLTFANAISTNGQSANPRGICEVVAQESAHAFGLEHAFDCSDPMTYLPNCGKRYFRNKYVPCGELTERECSCGGTTQNSHEKLLAAFGPGSPTPPPQVELQLPLPDQNVDENFQIRVRANGDRGIGHVDLYINGSLFTSLDGKPPRGNELYIVYAVGVPDGILDIEARAFDDLGSSATQTITVQKGEPCTSPQSCLSGQECTNGRCTWTPGSGSIGDSCTAGRECASWLCPSDGDTQICTTHCTVGAAFQCPEDFACVAAGERGLCWPTNPPGDSGGCASHRSSLPILLVLCILAVAVRRRHSTAIPQRNDRWFV